MAKSIANVNNLPSHDTMVANILSVYASALPSHIHSGERWYTEAQEFASDLALGTTLTRWQTIAIVALCSPQRGWQHNKQMARTVVAAHLAGDLIPSLHTTDQHKKIDRVLACDGSYEACRACMSGPKETSFFMNICGDMDYVTVDRWAFAAAVTARLSDKDGGISRAAYKPLQAAWQEAARTLGYPVGILQAICWVALRGTGE